MKMDEEEVAISDESYSDDDEEEELDPRIQDELEKLNAATNSINHLEAELDEARAVFRQTLAGATYHLNGIAQKLGKCVEKSRPFYECYRQLRQSHGMLQKSTNQFERATGMHIAARTRVQEAEKRVFGAGPKRAFDTALQEMLNQATMEVNEAEKLKRDSWKKHQEDLKAYRDLELKVKRLYKKLKSSVERGKPYFEQKREFDRHLWQLKMRVDSIQLGLSGAKENYSGCLKSLEVISDDIHEKRKSKRMEAMLSKLQRESGVGADSSTEDETSLHASNLDLDFDSSLNFDKLDALSDDFTGNDVNNLCTAASSPDMETSVLQTSNSFCDTRIVYGLESSKNNKDCKELTEKIEGRNIEDEYLTKECVETPFERQDVPVIQNAYFHVSCSDVEISEKHSNQEKSTKEKFIAAKKSHEEESSALEAACEDQPIGTSNSDKELPSEDQVNQNTCKLSEITVGFGGTNDKSLPVESKQLFVSVEDDTISCPSHGKAPETEQSHVGNEMPKTAGEDPAVVTESVPTGAVCDLERLSS